MVMMVRPVLKLSWTVAAMLLAMAAVGGLAYWDAARDADEALEDFGEQQALIARSAVGTLGARLAAVRADAQLISSGPTPQAVTERYAAAPANGFHFVVRFGEWWPRHAVAGRRRPARRPRPHRASRHLTAAREGPRRRDLARDGRPAGR